MKNNKLLVIICCAILAVVVVFGVVFGITKISKGGKNPADSVTGFIEALKNVEVEKAAGYTTDGNTGSLDLESNNEDAVEMVKLYFKNLQYSVKNTTKEKDTAAVTVEISNKDLKTIFAMYATKAYEIALSKLNGNSNTTELDMETEMLEYFKTLFDSQEVQTVTNTVDVKLNKVDKEWKVVVDEALTDAMLPGINEVNESLGAGQ